MVAGGQAGLAGADHDRVGTPGLMQGLAAPPVASAAVTGHAPLLGTGEQPVGGFAQ